MTVQWRYAVLPGLELSLRGPIKREPVIVCHALMFGCRNDVDCSFEARMTITILVSPPLRGPLLS